VRIRWLTIFLDLPAADVEAAGRFWCQVTGSRLSLPRDAGRFVTLLPEHGDACVRLQRLDSGPPGCHPDLHLAAPDLPDAVDRAIALGAVHRRHEPGLDVLTSPGGLTFCLTVWEGERVVPAPNRIASPAVSRLDQLCLDVPPAFWDTETAFWSTLTGWPLTDVGEPEFRRLLVPGDLPVKLLLQRLDDPAPAVTAHPDLAAAPDRADLTREHTDRGAHIVLRTPLWTVLQPPRGCRYCLTDRLP